LNRYQDLDCQIIVNFPKVECSVIDDMERKLAIILYRNLTIVVIKTLQIFNQLVKHAKKHRREKNNRLSSGIQNTENLHWENIMRVNGYGV
jgi:hypothetical protein